MGAARVARYHITYMGDIVPVYSCTVTVEIGIVKSNLLLRVSRPDLFPFLRRFPELEVP